MNWAWHWNNWFRVGILLQHTADDGQVMLVMAGSRTFRVAVGTWKRPDV